MFAIVVEGTGRPRRRVVFDGVAKIGRSTRSTLVLPAPEVSRSHAQIQSIRDGRFELVDFGSGHGTFVDGERITKMMVTGREHITIGRFALAIEPNAQPDATEQRLLAAIAANDTTSRQVYADWLEETGQLERADFLRAQEALVGLTPEHPTFARHSTRLRELAASIEMEWRYAVARPAVENCNTRFNLQCPKEWGSMRATERADIRHCDTCNSKVYYAATVREAARLVEGGACVAVDIIPLRSRGDLEPPPRVRTMGMMPLPSFPRG